MIIDKLIAGMIELVEQGRVSDKLIRAGIRKLCKSRLNKFTNASEQANQEHLTQLIARCKSGPVAPVPEAANEQHYEVPSEFFFHTLGKRLKYSSCFYKDDAQTLDQAEENSLEQTCERAEIENGMKILELGCGWGSLTLWLAEKYPECEVTAVSNSQSQREHILRMAKERGIDQNLRVITADMNDFEIDEKFDRVISIEMFEHMRNYEILLRRVSNWLADHGKLFVHIFCHKSYAYEFSGDGAANWMGRLFFTGGIMPSETLFEDFADDMKIQTKWRWNGENYARTADDWVRNMDRNRDEILPILEKTYGHKNAKRWFQRWRILFMAGAELFRYKSGEEWFVCHYLFEKVAKTAEWKEQMEVEQDVFSTTA